MNAVDTNILVYAIDAAETIKGAAAMALLDRLSADDTILLWQVACEFGSAVAKIRSRGGTSLDPWDALALMRARFPLVIPDEDVLDVARSLQRDGRIAYWDALLLAACIRSGITQLFTEDLPGTTTVGDLQIVNPFATR